MQPHKTVEEYLNKAVPEKLTFSVKTELRAELEGHIYDKAEFYMGIGYDEQTAFQKAVEEMGKAETVREEFDDLYTEKSIFAIIAFALMHIFDFIASISGFGGAVFFLMMIDRVDYLYYSSYESFIISSGFVCAVVILIAYCYKENKIKMLKAISVSNLLFSIFPWFGSSLYFPFAYRLLDFFFETDFSDFFDFYVSVSISIPLCIISFILFVVLKSKKSNTQSLCKKERLFRIIYICLILCFTSLVAMHTVSISNGYDNYNYSVISGYITEKDNEEKIQKEEDIFDYINKDMSYKQVDEVLRHWGYVPHTEFYEYIDNQEELEYELGYMKQRMVDADNDILYINLSKDEKPSWSLSSIVIPRNEDGYVAYKKYNYNYDSLKYKGKKSKECFKKLNMGDEKETVLKLMKKSYAVESIKIEYKNEKAVETYYFYSTYDNGDLFYHDYTEFYAEISFVDSVLIKGNYSSNRYFEEYDEKKDKNQEREETESYVIK